MSARQASFDQLPEMVNRLLEEVRSLRDEVRQLRESKALNPRQASDGMLSLQEVAERLHYSEKHVRAWAKSGELPARRRGEAGRWRFKAADVEAFEERLRVRPGDATSYQEKAAATLQKINGGK